MIYFWHPADETYLQDEKTPLDMHSVLPSQGRLESQTLAQSESGEEQPNAHLPVPMSAFVVPGEQPQSAWALQPLVQTPLLEQRFESQAAFAAQAAPIVPVSPRVIDFEHCFPDEASARAFRAAVMGSVLDVRLIRRDPGADRGWEVQCRARMVPTHAAITQTELRFSELAQTFGGFADGWGSLSNPDGSPAE